MFKHLVCVIMAAFCALALAAQTPRETEHFTYIVELHDSADYLEAEFEIGSFRSLYPQSVYQVYIDYLNANIALLKGEHTSAQELFRELINQPLEPEILADIHLNYAISLFYTEDYTEAIKRLQELKTIIDHPYYNNRFYLWRGRIYAAQGFHRSAEYDLKLALKALPEEAGLDYFKILLLLDQDEEALSWLNSLSPQQADYQDYVITWLEYLFQEQRLAEFDQFASDYQTQLRDDLRDRILLLRTQRAIDLGDYPTATAQLDSLRARSDKAIYYSALIYKQEGRTAEADSLLKQLVTSPEVQTRVLAYAERLKILFESDPEAATFQLKNYLATTRQNYLRGELHYLLAVFLFRQGQFAEAIRQCVLAKDHALSALYTDRAEDLIAETYYHLGDLQQCLDHYNRYLNQFPEGRARDKALYYIGAISFDLQDYSLARSNLELLLQQYPASQYADEARFHLAELHFFASDYSAAIDLYQSILMTHKNYHLVVLRLAQCYYYQDLYQEALKVIEGIEETEVGFDALILTGGVHFNQREYDTALEYYSRAESLAISTPQTTEARSYRAYTLYYQKRYAEAAQLFYELSRDSLNADIYLYQAGKAAYQGGDFKRALSLFNDFINEFPESDQFFNVLKDIALTQFNLGNFELALADWQNILRRFTANTSISIEEQALLAEVFIGIEITCKRIRNMQSIEELADIIDTFRSDYIKFELQYILVKLYADIGQWQELLREAEALRSSLSSVKRNEIELLMAQSLINLNRYAEADSLVSSVYDSSQSVESLLKWAELAVLTGNRDLAVERYLLAWHKQPEPAIWLGLIDVSVQNSFYRFDEIWEMGAEYHQDHPQTRLHDMNYRFALGDYEQAREIADSILDRETNSYYRALAEMVLGLISFKQEDYGTALRIFNKIRVLHKEFPDIFSEVNYYYILCLIKSGALQEALMMLWEVQDTLDNDRILHINGLLNQPR